MKADVASSSHARAAPAGAPAEASASTATGDLRALLRVVKAVRQGDFSIRAAGRGEGELAELAEAFNDVIALNEQLMREVERVRRVAGQEGRLGERVSLGMVGGGWAATATSINALVGEVTQPTREAVGVLAAVARGDLTRRMELSLDGRPLQGEFSRMARTVNATVDYLSAQVRGIVKVVSAIAHGDLTQHLVLDAPGEVAVLASTLNAMTQTLRTFAEQVSTVAREVGVEGKLGGQARVPGASGVWKELTDNVNQLAGHLTTQVRAIAEVSTSVTKGDLTRSIGVSAQGEVAALADNINRMICNLRATTEKNQEQDWLKTNLARFSGMLQGQRSLGAVAQMIMSELTPLVRAQYGAFFVVREDDSPGHPVLELIASYAFSGQAAAPTRVRFKEGLIGQCAFDKKPISLEVPGDYVVVASGLGAGRPTHVLVLPVLFEGEVRAVIELASWQRFGPTYRDLLGQLTDSIGVVLNVIASSMRTEELLSELQCSNAGLGRQARELEDKAALLEQRNRQIEEARRSIEEKAEQLTIISRYKSEFLANMSHELRTPLNSLLILSKILVENKPGTLTPEQLRFASTIYGSGCDLLGLIDEILDLSKIEAGKMPIEATEVELGKIAHFLAETFHPVAAEKSLGFSVDLAPDLPQRICTDTSRLQQILKNLLSNAFKFTEAGRVSLEIGLLAEGKRFGVETLDGCCGRPPRVVCFAVRDTGVGIAADKHELIFEAFQQADGTTSRRYGGTGLGLTISREIAQLLGGVIEVASAPGQGSVFTLYLPLRETNRPVLAGRVVDVPESSEVPPGAYAELRGRKVLVVDDDIRTVFALTSVLEAHMVCVIYAENGCEALRRLADEPDIALVLLDVQMPQMDGIAALHEIRKQTAFRNLPIVSLTAKAMKGDRERCMAAGASDYLAKPIASERLLATLSLWLKAEDGQ